MQITKNILMAELENLTTQRLQTEAHLNQILGALQAVDQLMQLLEKAKSVNFPADTVNLGDAAAPPQQMENDI